MISTLYNGPHYSAMQKYKDRIQANHIAFAEYNNIPYKLYDEKILYDYNLIRQHDDKTINIPGFMPGIGKMFACLQAFLDFPELEYVMFVDFDSLFLNSEKINNAANYENGATYKDNKITRSCRQHAYLYDMSYVYYYCIYKNKNFEEVNKLLYRYNSGLFIIKRDTFDIDMLNDYVNFSYQIFLEKSDFVDSVPNHMNISYKESQSAEHQLFHPSDEVFWQWLNIECPQDISVFNNKWNYLGSPWHDITNISEPRKNQLHNLVHVHCINKDNIRKWLELGVFNEI